ncbi:MAG: TRAP transporter substrate-binding protein DctP [Desulfatibacillaceae bacterium]
MLKKGMAALIVLALMLPAATWAVEFKMATLSPDGTTWMELLRQGAREISERTGGEVTFKFYPGGVMGNDNAVLRKIRIGQLHGGAIMAGSLSRDFPDSVLYYQYLKFRDYDEVDYVRARMDHVIIEGLREKGYEAFGLAEGGFAYIFSKTPVRGVGDLQTTKTWMPEANYVPTGSLKKRGVSPIPLSLVDVRAGLQTGLVETVTAPPVAALAMQWHTSVRYMTDLPLTYTYALITMGKRHFDRLSPEHQKIVTEVFTDITRQLGKHNRKDSAEARRALVAQGIELVAPTAKDVREWNDLALDMTSAMVGDGQLSRDLVEEMAGHLDDYRNGHTGG